MPELFPQLGASIPWLTEAQMREVDRAMVNDYGIAVLQMMEHAGRNLASVARTSFFGGSAAGKNVLIAAGRGGNGGGGLSGGRQLYNMGANVTVVLTSTVENLTTGETLACEPVPEHLMEMVASGGLMAHLKKKLGQDA